MELDTTNNIEYFETNPEVQEEIVESFEVTAYVHTETESIVNDYLSWIEVWVDDTRSVAQEVWDTYVGDESLLDAEAYEILDTIVLEQLSE